MVFSSLCLLDVHEERLVLRRLRVGVADVGGQVVHHAVARAEDAGPAVVVREADLVLRLPVDGERLHALGDHGVHDDGAAVVPDVDLVAARDALLGRQLFGDLDELGGHGFDQGRAGARLAAGLPVLGHRVGRRHDRVLVDRAVAGGGV